MQFSDIVGHKVLIERLVASYNEKRFSPVLLFDGHEGCGAFALARALAQFLICDIVSSSLGCPLPFTASGHAPPNEGSTFSDSCGKCASCLRVKQFSHPDVHYFYPVVSLAKSGANKEKRISSDYLLEWQSFMKFHPHGNLADWLAHTGEERKQANMSALECEQISKAMRMKSYEGKYKICIIWMPEILGKEANRLLKDIEEPTPGTFILMVTSNGAALLPTLRSRCLTIHVPQPEDKDIDLHLKKQMPDMSSAEREVAIACAKGDLRFLHNILQKDTSLPKTEAVLIAMFDALIKGGPSTQLTWIEEQCKQGKIYILELLHTLLKYIANYISLRNIRSAPKDAITYRRFYPVKLFATFQKIRMSSKAALVCEVIEYSVLGIRSNSHPKLELHSMLVKCHAIFRQGRYMFSLFN